ncbi:hypothetical protein SSCG_04788 [Streptomyces clavuligerus]|nr:hypothetical protein SSCG_04788 [Streptomyces clavuligerus]
MRRAGRGRPGRRRFGRAGAFAHGGRFAFVCGARVISSPAILAVLQVTQTQI